MTANRFDFSPARRQTDIIPYQNQALPSPYGPTQVMGTLTPPAQRPSMASTIAAPAMGGLQAGQSVGPSYDFTSGAINVGTATAAGAAMGGMVGGPMGAVVGGGVGLLTSGVNAWMSVAQENKRKREMDKFIKEAEEKQAAREARDRADAASLLRFNRKEAERAKAWGVAQNYHARINQLISSNQTLREKFIATGIKNA